MILWSLQSHKNQSCRTPKRTPRHCLWDNFPIQPSWSRLYFRKKHKGNFSGGLGWTVMELFWVLTTHDLFEESAAHQKHREICFIHHDEEKQTHFLLILRTRCLMWRPNKKSLAEYEPTFRWPTEFAEDFQHASKLKNEVFFPRKSWYRRYRTPFTHWHPRHQFGRNQIWWNLSFGWDRVWKDYTPEVKQIGFYRPFYSSTPSLKLTY